MQKNTIQEIAPLIEKEIQQSIQAVERIHHTTDNMRSIFFDVTTASSIQEKTAQESIQSFFTNNPTYKDRVVELVNISRVNPSDKSNTDIVTRIHIQYFADAKTKEEYDKERAQHKDHRELGEQLDLWTFSKLVGSGLPLFTPKGTIIREELSHALDTINKRYGAQRVTIPHIAKIDLYKISGHAEKFGDELFEVKGKHDDFILKPANCPQHTQIYASKPRSYRDLPIRYIETSMQYRDEQPGELLGLARVRSITLDDGHTFCTIDQVEEEVTNIANTIKEFYGYFGLWGNHYVSLSARDPNTPEKYIGSDEDWNKAEGTLQKVSDALGLHATRVEGEAALYGPKLDYMFKDSKGREWQLATVQLDFSMPKEFELTYKDKDGKDKTPVMIHRALLGSYERFLSILLEHFNGWLPCWVAPTQVAIVAIHSNHEAYATKIYEAMKEKDIRAVFLDAQATLGKNKQEIISQKIPFNMVIGDKEADEEMVTVEATRSKEKAYTSSPEDAIAFIIKHIKEKEIS